MTDVAAVFDSHAAAYDDARRRLIPPFESFYGTAVEAVRLSGPEPQRILDLGAGTGLLSQLPRATFPSVRLTLLDAAPMMLERAREALGEHGVNYLKADLRDPLPAGPWDAVVSGLAIHHLRDEDKQALMADVYGALRPGGVLVNAEQVAGPTPFFTDVYAQWHEQGARSAGTHESEWQATLTRMSHDLCATVEDQLRWLREAGFANADCLFKEYRFAVLVAIKPPD
jgi:tRNA (cmo5U34)-methyltransferase